MTELEIKQYIGSKLKQFRIANNMEQLQVANKINSSANHVSQIESGYVMPNILTLKKYCDIYGVEAADILPF